MKSYQDNAALLLRLAENTGISPTDPSGTSAPVPAPVDERIDTAVNYAVDTLSAVENYLKKAKQRPGMRNDELFKRVNALRLDLDAVEPLTYPFDNQQSLTITHSRGRFVQPACYDQQGNQVEGSLTQPDANTVQVQFSQPLSGTVVLS